MTVVDSDQQGGERLIVLGVDPDSGRPVVPSTTIDDLVSALPEFRRDVVLTAPSPTFGPRPPVQQPNPAEPVEAGWAVVVADDDPQRDDVLAALEPLSRHRRARDPFVYQSGRDVADWLAQESQTRGDARPSYLLLAGDPVHLPFDLQVHLAAADFIPGRVCFAGPERLADLGRYAAKVVGIETSDAVPAAAEAVVLSADGGPADATHYSNRFLVPPVAAALESQAKLRVTSLSAADATADRFLSAVTSGRPAVVFTATHGAGKPKSGGTDDQRRHNGSLGCAPGPGAPPTQWQWLAAHDLPAGRFAPGALVIQFACFSAGTSSSSSFSRWLSPHGTTDYDAVEPFVAALPQRLLAAPEGPVAFVGHVDVAVLHGFADPAGITRATTPQPRLQPFLALVDDAVQEMAPIGFALRDLWSRATLLGSQIVTTVDDWQAQGIGVEDVSPTDKQALVDMVIRRNDAMHFLVLGDPAVRLRIDDV